MRTVWGTVTIVLVVAFVAVGCGTKTDEGESTKVETEKKVSPKMMVQADDVTSKREAVKKPEPAAEPDAEPAVEPEAEPAVEPETKPAAEPEPAPAAATDAPELKQTDGLMLASIVLARGIEKRKPVEAGTSFKADKGVFLYTIVDVLNPEREATSIKVSWRHADADKEIGGVTLKVKDQQKWKTWAKTGGIFKPGKWVAIVRDENGDELGRAPFELTD